MIQIRGNKPLSLCLLLEESLKMMFIDLAPIAVTLTITPDPARCTSIDTPEVA